MSNYLNVRLFNKFSKDRQQEIMRRINQTMVLQNQLPFTDESWKQLPDQIKAMLLDREAYFATIASYIYTKMMDRASKYKRVESRRFAVEMIESWFSIRAASGVAFSLTGQERNNIRRSLERMWTL